MIMTKIFGGDNDEYDHDFLGGILMIMTMIFFCRGSDDNLQVKAHQEESSECQILLLGDFHKRGPLEIPV